ncbi:hypothetical protein QNA23_05845 [Rhodococcus erythropolis]|uniref:hypothetical protein n=1 Tax=Rhodococcus TaxID=1827 RepID=UPI00114204E1|nr:MULTISPECIES: hypothetical protein [Rhodococcus]MDJ0402989.1 hypothetical protein [Rhodococcus erythropolis]TQC39803.1 hypothetical protein EEB16_08550 [Rhodococcus sp. WS7]
MSGHRGNESLRPGTPGLGFAFAAVPFLAVLAGVRYDWWRYPRPAVLLLEPATVGSALLGLAVVGTLWIFRSYGYWKREQRWSWRTGLAPMVVATTALVFVLVPTPREGAFDRARGGMEAVAHSIQQNPTPYAGQRTVINELEFHVYIKEGCVFFADLEQSVVHNAGWIYTANCTLNPDESRRYKPVAENWYAFL